MSLRYNPLIPPPAEHWLRLDERQRLELVRRYHRRAKPSPPRLDAHAALHVAVETQIAMGQDTPAAKAARRLMDEGLDRHEAIHALGALVAHIARDLTAGQAPLAHVKARYFAEVEALTAERWRQSV